MVKTNPFLQISMVSSKFGSPSSLRLRRSSSSRSRNIRISAAINESPAFSLSTSYNNIRSSNLQILLQCNSCILLKLFIVLWWLVLFFFFDIKLSVSVFCFLFFFTKRSCYLIVNEISDKIFGVKNEYPVV